MGVLVGVFYSKTIAHGWVDWSISLLPRGRCLGDQYTQIKAVPSGFRTTDDVHGRPKKTRTPHSIFEALPFVGQKVFDFVL